MRIPRHIRFCLGLSTLTALAGCQSQLIDAPASQAVHTLQSGELVLQVMDPNDLTRYNRGVRFTPVAAIISARLDGHEFLFNSSQHNPLTDAAGLFADFDLITPPPGFTEAKLGDGYLKIGVGVLKKDAEKYNFWPQHQLIHRAETRVQWETDSAQFHQTCPPCNGYGYDLDATITVEPDSIVVNWRLKNTGDFPFQTQQYTHNCFRPDQQPVGPGYALMFPYDIAPVGLQPQQQQQRRAIRFTQPIDAAVNIRVPYPTDYDGPNMLTAACDRTGQFITFTTSLPGDYTAVHVSADYLCPEQFVTIRLAPGQQANWSRHYTLGINIK